MNGGNLTDPKALHKPIPTQHDTWKCVWKTKEGTPCENEGSLTLRVGKPYFRHVCYGHGRDHDVRREPIIFYVCSDHYREFTLQHGLADEPEWIRRKRLDAEYNRLAAEASARQQ